MNKEELIHIIYLAIDDYNELNQNAKIIKDEDTFLYGDNGNIDSLGLVNLILSIEEKLMDKYNKNIILADDKAFSEENSPFKNISTLTKFIQKKVNEQQDK